MIIENSKNISCLIKKKACVKLSDNQAASLAKHSDNKGDKLSKRLDNLDAKLVKSLNIHHA